MRKDQPVSAFKKGGITVKRRSTSASARKDGSTVKKVSIADPQRSEDAGMSSFEQESNLKIDNAIQNKFAKTPNKRR